MTQRYTVEPGTDGYAVLRDAETGELVRTGSGIIYCAPTANVQWTADTMNRTAETTPDAAPVAREEETEPAMSLIQVLTTVADEDNARNARHAAPRTAWTDEDMDSITVRLAQEQTASAQGRALRYARRTGELEAEIRGIRSQLIGTLAGLRTVSLLYPEIRAEVAEKRLAELQERVESIIATFDKAI